MQSFKKGLWLVGLGRARIRHILNPMQCCFIHGGIYTRWFWAFVVIQVAMLTTIYVSLVFFRHKRSRHLLANLHRFALLVVSIFNVKYSLCTRLTSPCSPKLSPLPRLRHVKLCGQHCHIIATNSTPVSDMQANWLLLTIINSSNSFTLLMASGHLVHEMFDGKKCRDLIFTWQCLTKHAHVPIDCVW